MATKLKPHPYHFSFPKRLLDLTLAIVGLIILSPFYMAIATAIKLSSKGPVFFSQKRTGYRSKPFKIIMFRTMYVRAERDQGKFAHLNEADGPVFKIRDDPRFVGIGKFLAGTGLDELPQLINVLKGEMSMVGPRPLPVAEAKKLTKEQRARELIKPGITSSWVVNGAHKLRFSEWMRLDTDYVENGSLLVDLKVLVLTTTLILKSIPRQLLKKPA